MSQHPLDTPDVPVDTDRALAHIRARIERERLRPVVIERRPVAGRWDRALNSAWTKGLAAATSVVLALTLLTVSGVAETIITLFEPKQVVAVPITQADLRSVDSFTRFGTLTWSAEPKPYDVPDAATAARESGLAVLQPRTLPAGVTGLTPRFGVMPLTTATFTFDAELARRSAAAQGKTLPPMPAKMDGSKLFITGGPAVVQYYVSQTTAQSSNVPALIVAQGKAPVVQSDGVTVEELQQYLLAQPGISPQLAAQIRAIKDPSSTLPIPIPIDKTNSKQVTVQGVQGVFVGDSTGLGSAVIWSKGGVVFGVAGTLTEAEILAVANSLQ